MATYSLGNFLGTPVQGDVTIKIYDKSKKLRYDINPNIAYFFTKSNIVIIRIEDKNDIYLDFDNQNDAGIAASMLNDAKKDILTPTPKDADGGLSIDEQRKLGFYHTLSKSVISNEQSLQDSKYKSAHNVRLQDVWADEITPVLTFEDAILQSVTNDALTFHEKVELRKVSDSYGQTWYFRLDGRFVRPWVGPQDIPFSSTNLPSEGFELKLFRGDDCKKGVPGSEIKRGICEWAVEYHAGIIHFGEGNTPDDFGWGTIKASFFEYTGDFGAPSVTDAFTDVSYDENTGLLVFNEGQSSEKSVTIVGGGGSLTIEDEGSEVLSGVTNINFIGVGVRAQSGFDGTTRRVNVYIPTPDYVSNFNTTNGTTTATVLPVSTTNRYVALPDSEGTPYKVGDWSGGDIVSTIRNNVNTLTYVSTEFSIYEEDTTTLEVVVFDADGTTSLATHQITLDGNSTQTSNDITINITGWDTDADRFKANSEIEIDIDTILPEGGRFSVRITHDNIEDTYTFTQNNIFKDTENLTTQFGSGSELEVIPETPTIKYNSGVQFYTIGSEWRIDLDEINNLNSRSYPTTQQVRIESTNFSISEVINIHGEDGVTPYEFNTTTWTEQHDTTGAEFTKIDWITDVDNQSNWVHGTCGINPNTANSNIYDWGSSPVDNITSSNYNYLIDTYDDDSTRNSEMFRREDHPTFPRLQSDLTTPWDSTVSLLSIDGGDGLQVLADRLVYPQCDFTQFTPSTQPDYTGTSGNKVYYRRFETNGSNVSNGIIVFSDHNLTESDLDNNDFILELSPNGTDWFTFNLPYTGGTIPNGGGCRIDELEYGLGVGSDNSSALRFSLGQGGSTTFIYLRFTYSDTSNGKSKYIGGIDVTSGNWN